MEIIKFHGGIHQCHMVQDSLINALKSCQAIQFGHFVLTSGAVSDYYIDIKKASTHPSTLRLIAREMKPLVTDCDILAGMELGAVPLMVALSLETDIPYVIVRKEKKGHGTGKMIEGGEVKDKKVVIIEDVTTSGGSVEKTITIIRNEQGIVHRVIAVVDRECGARGLLEKHQVEFTPLLSVSDILDR